MVDSNDRDRLINPNKSDQKNWEVFADSGLRLILQEDELRDATVLIFANKQDIPGCMSVTEVAAGLRLDELKSKEPHRKIHIMGCSANKGEGLREGLDWLLHALQNKITVAKGKEESKQESSKYFYANENNYNCNTYITINAAIITVIILL